MKGIVLAGGSGTRPNSIAQWDILQPLAPALQHEFFSAGICGKQLKINSYGI